MKKKLLFTTVVALAVTTTMLFTACSGSKYDASLPSYNMNVLDLSSMPSDVDPNHAYMFQNNVVDSPTYKVTAHNKKQYYLGHPDNVLLDNGDILTAYPIGHGKGTTLLARSKDDGVTWNKITGLPETFNSTEETPTIYKLDFVGDKAGEQKLVLASARPGWGKYDGEGFDVSVSTSGTTVDGQFQCDGATWSSHKNYFSDHAEAGFVAPNNTFKAIVAMASLTQLKDADGNLTNSWMGIFHDYDFHVYKSILTFNEDADGNDQMNWSYPKEIMEEKYYEQYEKKYQLCEPEVVRSPEGNEIAMIFRANTRTSNSFVIFSTDEGATWTEPKQLAYELTGERHKAEYDPTTGKLVITYRSINWKIGQEHKVNEWYSRGWLTWVGDYSDLKKGLDGKGDYVVKMAHTYSGKQTAPEEFACDDTGYAGLTIDSSGLIVSTSYGRFSPYNDKTYGKKTYVVTKRLKLNDINAHFGLTLFPTV